MMWIRAVAFRDDPVKTCHICRCLRTTLPFGNNYIKVFFEVLFVRLRRVYRSMTMLRCDVASNAVRMAMVLYGASLRSAMLRAGSWPLRRGSSRAHDPASHRWSGSQLDLRKLLAGHKIYRWLV